MFNRQLFEGPNLRLMPVDPEKDAVVEAAWMYDLDYAQTLRMGQTRPLAAFELKKHYENAQKQAEESRALFLFGIHLKADGDLIGFLRIPHVFWNHGSAVFQLSIGQPEKLSQYGPEALELLLAYAFRELNLYRVETNMPAYRSELIALYEQAGFLLEIRRRQVIFRDGKHWDALYYGLLQSEWESREQEALGL